MDNALKRISEILQQLPTASVTQGEYNDRPAIYAGDEPIFLVRTTGESGPLYAGAVAEVFTLIAQLVGEQPADNPTAKKKAMLNAETEAKVLEAIVSTVSMQPEFKAKADLFSKLLLSAITPYLSGVAPVMESGN